MIYNNDDQQTKLLNLTYLKLQSVKYNKLSKRPIETPLQQSVIVWNFLKKLEINIQNNWKCNEKEQVENIEPVIVTNNNNKNVDNNNRKIVDADDENESNKENLMDCEPCIIPIGSERRTKLLNKLESKQVQQPQQPQPQPQQSQSQSQYKKRKSSLFNSTNIYYSIYDDDFEDDYFENDNLVDTDYKFLTTTTTTQQFNLWSNSFNYLNKSCSYESSQTNHQDQYNQSVNNIEHSINILIECE